MSGDNMADFVSSINTGLSMSAIWGAIAPIAPLMITLTLVAITRYVLNKNFNKARKGGSARV